MNAIYHYADVLMSIGWVVTYVLVLISTYRTQIPAMAPVACVLGFSWEITAFINSILKNEQGLIFWAHLGWCTVDFLIIVCILFRTKYYKKSKICVYILALAIVIAIMFWIFKLPNGMMYTSYINTFIGMLIWLFYTIKTEYPITKINVSIMFIKFFADLFALIRYYEHDNFIFCMSMALVLVDAIHILVLGCKTKREINLYRD